MRWVLASTFAIAALTSGACGDVRASRARTDDTSEGLLAAAQSGTLAADEPIDVALLGFDRGSTDAPVRVVEMSDYGCGYCRQFHEETWPVLKKEFVDAGKVRWKFLPFVTGMFKNSPYASVAAECTLEQDDALFETVNARIWKDQKAWKGSSEPAGVLRTMVADAGVDMARFDACVSENHRRDRLAAADKLARQVGVRGTPTFFVVGYQPVQGAPPTDMFRGLLAKVYEDATQGREGR